MRPLIGDVIAGKYRIDNVAGEGGMGIVYEAEHIILQQRVALKALLPGSAMSADAIERFSLEASAVARITSEHVVRIMDAGSLPNGAPYIVMEYLEGCDLGALLTRRGPLPVPEVVDYTLQALEALAHAHSARVIHRDLKPPNLFLVNRADGSNIIKLVDFGIARTFDTSSEDNRVMGSPAYMSPEQLRNELVDPRSDLWSLGVVIYELLSGAAPFEGSVSEIITTILEGGPLALDARVPTVPSGLAEIVARCLLREREARWSSTAELARAIVEYGSGAWSGAVERIERALTSPVPQKTPRRFESLELALQSLEAEWQREKVSSTLPPQEPTADAFRATERPLETKLPALRILLLDDSELTLDVHEACLANAGFDVRATTSIAEFEALLEEWKPHLALIEVLMPLEDGDVVCQRVKAKKKAALPIVLVSSLPNEVLSVRATRAGADAFFQKIGDLSAFLAFVRNICAITYSPEDLPDESV